MRRQREIEPISLEERSFLEGFYDQYFRFFYYIADKYAQTEREKDEIAQDAMVRLLRRASVLKGMDHPKICKYIALTVKAAYLDIERRKCASSMVCLDDGLLEMLETREQEMVPDLFSRLAVEQLRESLSPRDWLALEGKYILGYSQEELGKMLGIEPDSVRMILCRAREKSRSILFAGNSTGGGDDDDGEKQAISAGRGRR